MTAQQVHARERRSWVRQLAGLQQQRCALVALERRRQHQAKLDREYAEYVAEMRRLTAAGEPPAPAVQNGGAATEDFRVSDSLMAAIAAVYHGSSLVTDPPPPRDQRRVVSGPRPSQRRALDRQLELLEGEAHCWGGPPDA